SATSQTPAAARQTAPALPTGFRQPWTSAVGSVGSQTSSVQGFASSQSASAVQGTTSSLKAPPPSVPGQMGAGPMGSTTASTNGLVRPGFTAVHCPPSSMLRKTPPPKVAASTVVRLGGSTTRSRPRTVVVSRPLLAALQVSAPSVLLNTPPPSVAA